MKLTLSRVTKNRRFAVDPKLRYGFTFLSLAYATLLLLVVAYAIFWPIIGRLQEDVSGSPEADEAAGTLLYLHGSFWPFALLALILICVHSVRVSRRIAAALLRFDLALLSVKNGVIPAPVRLRKGDYLHSQKKIVNSMLASLGTKLRDIHEARRELRAAIDECRRTAPEGSDRDLLARLDALADKEHELEERLSHLRAES